MSAPPDAQRWLDLAEEDLADAEDLRERGRWRNACYLAQQAAEKAVKAVLVSQGTSGWGHDIAALAVQASPASAIRSTDADLAALSTLVTEARYPIDIPEPGEPEARAAVADARKLVEAGRVDLGSLGQ
jgi:HEPN domain-containing protein